MLVQHVECWCSTLNVGATHWMLVQHIECWCSTLNVGAAHRMLVQQVECWCSTLIVYAAQLCIHQARRDIFRSKDRTATRRFHEKQDTGMRRLNFNFLCRFLKICHGMWLWCTIFFCFSATQNVPPAGCPTEKSCIKSLQECLTLTHPLENDVREFKG